MTSNDTPNPSGDTSIVVSGIGSVSCSGCIDTVENLSQPVPDKTPTNIEFNACDGLELEYCESLHSEDKEHDWIHDWDTSDDDYLNEEDEKTFHELFRQNMYQWTQVHPVSTNHGS
jgi:hypothetical protein